MQGNLGGHDTAIGIATKQFIREVISGKSSKQISMASREWVRDVWGRDFY